MGEHFYWNATVLTQDSTRPVANALWVRDGKIAAVGEKSDVEAALKAGTPRIDLGGRTVVPGFNDAHVHVWKVGHLLTSMLDLRGAKSLGGIRDAIGERARKAPAGAWILGRGYNEAQMQEGRGPTRADLDEACSERPVYLTRTCGHISVANSKALQMAGVTRDSRAPSGGVIVRDDAGEPTGELHETAMSLVGNRVPEPSDAEYEEAVLAGARHQIALGITSATEAGVMPSLLAVYRSMDARGALPYRVNVMALRRPLGGPETLPLPAYFVSDFLRTDTIKILADGGLSGATAALRKPYKNSQSTGVLRVEREEMFSLCEEAQRAGLRIGVHAIGDRTIDITLDVFERLAALCPGKQHRLEHFGLPWPEQIGRAAKLGCIAVPQAIFIRSLGKNFRRYLTDEMLERAYPIADMIRSKMIVALSSDAPVVANDSPLFGMVSAQIRKDEDGVSLAPGQCISAAEALYAYTAGGAFASGDEENRGTLSVGKWADFAVLSANPLLAPPVDCPPIEVEQTYIGGVCVFEK